MSANSLPLLQHVLEAASAFTPERLMEAVRGATLVVGITSAGRISPTLPLPAIVVIDEAVRDEGTSLHRGAVWTYTMTKSPGARLALDRGAPICRFFKPLAPEMRP